MMAKKQTNKDSQEPQQTIDVQVTDSSAQGRPGLTIQILDAASNEVIAQETTDNEGWCRVPIDAASYRNVSRGAVVVQVMDRAKHLCGWEVKTSRAIQNGLRYTCVPDVIGDSVETAAEKVEIAKLNLVVEDHEANEANDLIIAQEPAPDQIVMVGSNVTVEVQRSEGDTCIQGTIFFDVSGDATRQNDELPLPSVTVKLFNTTTPDQLYAETTSGEDGRFEFRVAPGNWIVRLPETIEPTGMPRLSLSESRLASIETHVAPGQTVDVGEIGYEAQGGFVSGTIFYDRDRTGVPGNNPRLPDVEVTLLNLTTQKSYTTKSDVQGVYYFANPEAGSYLLQFKPAPDGTKIGLGKSALKLPDKQPGAFTFSPGQQIVRDLGYWALGGTIYGIVFLDQDANGYRSGSEQGIEGIPVVLMRQEDGSVETTKTRPTGEYWFEDLTPGTYVLRFSQIATVGDSEYNLTSPSEQKIHMRAAATVQAAPTGYEPEVHEIRGRVVFDNGQGIPNVVVTLTDSEGVQYTATTDKDGYYVFKDLRGEFTVSFGESPYDSELLTPPLRKVEVNSVVQVPDTVYRFGGGTLPGGSLGGSQQDTLADIASYMPTSQEVGGSVSRGGYAGAGSGAGMLQHLVDSTMQAMFGRKVQVDDGKGALEAINRAFVIERENGKKKVIWQPRIYVVQTELGGAITGAQASLYRRAKAALDDAIPLLDGLETLTATADEEEVEAARSIVRTEFTELVNELGLESGPRPQRVDSIFTLLVDQLERFPRVFGLNQENIISVDEEQQLTDFLIIKDYVLGLRSTWRQFREEFKDTKFLGTQLVLLERTLSAVTESVEETYRVMDSVFLGPAERQTVRISFSQMLDGQVPPPLFVEELLSWVSRFASVESPVLIRDGGRRGVETMAQIAHQLYGLVTAAANAEVAHVGFSRIRVRRSLSELASQIGQTETLALELLQTSGETGA